MSAIPAEATLAVLEEELATVRWMASKAPDDQKKAAASLRAVELGKEIERFTASMAPEPAT